MSYFEELLNDPNTVWSITRQNIITKETKEFVNIYASYDTAVDGLCEWCERMAYDLYEGKDETQFIVCEHGSRVAKYNVTIYARTLVK